MSQITRAIAAWSFSSKNEATSEEIEKSFDQSSTLSTEIPINENTKASMSEAINSFDQRSTSPKTSHTIKSHEAAHLTLLSLVLELENNLNEQIQLYTDLKALEVKMYEFEMELSQMKISKNDEKDKENEEELKIEPESKIGQKSEFLNNMSKSDLSYCITTNKAKVNTLVNDFSKNLIPKYESAVSLYKSTASLCYHDNYKVLAIHMNVSLAHWKLMVEGMIKSRNDAFLDYTKVQSSVIEGVKSIQQLKEEIRLQDEEMDRKVEDVSNFIRERESGEKDDQETI